MSDDGQDRPITRCDPCGLPAYDTGRTLVEGGRTWRIAWCRSCRSEITFWEPPALVTRDLVADGAIVGEALDHERERYVVLFHDEGGRPRLRTLDLGTGASADLAVRPAPRTRLVAVGDGVAAVFLCDVEVRLDDVWGDVEHVTPRMLEIVDTGSGAALWSVALDGEPTVEIVAGAVAVGWQPGFLRRGVPGRADQILDARTGEPVPGLDAATFPAQRAAAAARRPLHLSASDRLAEGDPEFDRWADRVAAAIGARPVHTMKATRFGAYDVVDCFVPGADGFAEQVLVLRGSAVLLHERPSRARATSHLVATSWTMTDPWRAGRWLVIAGTAEGRRLVLVDDAGGGTAAA